MVLIKSIYNKKPLIKGLFYLCKIIKKRYPKVPSSDLDYLKFNNMYRTPIQLLFFSMNNNWNILVFLTVFMLRYNNVIWIILEVERFV